MDNAMVKQSFWEKSWVNFLVNLVGIVIIVPLAPFICRFIPPLIIGDFNFDFILSILIAIIVVRLFIWLLKPMILPLFILVVLFFGYEQSNGEYTVGDTLRSYKFLVQQNFGIKEKKATDILNLKPAMFENIQSRTARVIQSKMDFHDSLVRNFAIRRSLEYFKEYKPKYGNLVRYFSLFKYINLHFNYVSDPSRDEYYATARETILNGFGGDCDDHSILMANSMMDIGAKCRLVIVQGHMYPELYIGSKQDFLVAQQAVIQLFSDYQISGIYYHENDGEYWINLDYTARYPGGPYMNNNVKLVIEL
ncbi:MAG: transglutaminase domain-containing protein [Chitinophagaceae bacterium]